MPRQSRIDTSGALHHIICRGMEQRDIFKDDTDRDNFVQRLSNILSETKTACYAWALIPNHFHLLLRTGKVPVSTVMRRLLTGYAVSFNRRHKRSGHLFQNRYKSILCQEDTYLMELVRYIHLNPLRAGIVPDLEALFGYIYSGHSRIMRLKKSDWQDVEKVVGMFGKRRHQALKKYEQFMAKGVGEGKKPELTGGGLIRSVGGWHELKELRKMKVHFKSDERVLGDSDFVEEVLGSASEEMERKYRLRAEGYTFEKIAGKVGELFDIKINDLTGPGKQPHRVRARSVLIFWAVQELGMTATEGGLKLGMSQSSVSRLKNSKPQCNGFRILYKKIIGYSVNKFLCIVGMNQLHNSRKFPLPLRERVRVMGKRLELSMSYSFTLPLIPSRQRRGEGLLQLALLYMIMWM